MSVSLCSHTGLLTVLTRRSLFGTLGGALALPMMEASATVRTSVDSGSSSARRFLVVGNPFGMHPDHFFPKDFGRDFTMSRTLKSMEWLRDRMSIFSHTDHGMKSGHGRELAFLSGVLPETADAFAEKNMSLDQIVARRTASKVRYPFINVCLERGIRMSWNANGVDIKPITDARRLHGHLFGNMSAEQRDIQRRTLERNGSVLDAVRDCLLYTSPSPRDS